ncbi:MAG TPA: Ig-like domain-containing protein [Ignavibacteriaceae bacterium]|nr:Ig-like domain-containing protein [Ignavibacteriaceae bacterium]
MVKISKYYYKIILFSFLFLAGCANQLPPGGGEKDTKPPTIVEVIPSDGTVNYNENYFELGFSEFVDKRVVKDALFISPAIEGELELDWSGKSVRVYFPGKLKANTTYSITVGTDVTDFHERNKMAEAFSFNFSTGPEIDRRTIAGRVFDEKPEDIMIYAFLLSDTSKVLGDRKPDYISQTGADGSYKVGGLAAGTYRVFAVRDEFRDLIFQPEQDKIGIPSGDIVLKPEDSLMNNINFFITEYDTVPPRLSNSVMTDAHHTLLSFSEPIDSLSTGKKNFFIYDSTDNKQIPIDYTFKGNAKPNEIILAIKNTIPLEHSTFIFANNIADKNKNIIKQDNLALTLSARPDTLIPDILKIIPERRSDKVDFQNTEIYFTLNDGFDTSLIHQSITFKDTLGNNVPFSIQTIDNASFKVKANIELQPRKDYLIRINFKNVVDPAGNFTDTTFIYPFKTISGAEFTGLQGSVSNIDVARNTVLILQGRGDVAGKIYKTKLTNGNKFSFNRVEPGKYLLWGFYDDDSSGTYNYGSLKPFTFSEEFSFHPSEINLRPRWVVTDFLFVFKKSE